jgi:ribosomal protein L40E
MSKQVRPELTFDLLDIQGITKGGKLVTWVSIADSSQEQLFHFGRVSDEDFVEKFRGPILQAAHRLRQNLEQTRTTNAVADAQAIAKAQVEMISCKYCEAKNASDKERCWRCGASL